MLATKFKFRSECILDVTRFLNLIEVQSVEITKAATFPDCVVILESKLKLETLVECAQCIPDGHVIVETLQLEENYTGDRIEGRR